MSIKLNTHFFIAILILILFSESHSQKVQSPQNSCVSVGFKLVIFVKRKRTQGINRLKHLLCL